MSLLGLLASSGSDEPNYVDEKFSAYTYTGNGSTQTIANGIDLAGSGGLVWFKGRDAAVNHSLYDTVKGIGSSLSTDSVNPAANRGEITSFNSNGFTVPSNPYGLTNYLGYSYASWTFRKAAKFFDVVTWTGNGAANRAISHALGTTVGMVITKSTSTTGDWNTYHRSATGDLVLNTTAAQTGSHSIVVSATDSTFTVTGVANTNGVTYVAYLFAHDTSTDGIVQCGSFTTASSLYSLNLSFEPQFILYKCSTYGAAGYDWNIYDTSRGLGADQTGLKLTVNLSNAEVVGGGNSPRINATGFSGGETNAQTYIYMAIRRSNKPPTSGTQVYNAIARTGTGAAATVTGVGFAPDLAIVNSRVDAPRPTFSSRLTGKLNYVTSVNSGSELNDSAISGFDVMDGIRMSADPVGYWNTNTWTYINWFFKRAVGVFDEVCYTGTGVARTVAHGLGVKPDLIIFKKRNSATASWWFVYASPLTATKNLTLDSTDAAGLYTATFNDTEPTATTFTVGAYSGTNGNNDTFVSYLFASKSGISKVGSYTGNGSSQTINMGFTTGARFFLCKATSTTGSWWIFDSVRGILSAADFGLQLNSTAAETTTADAVDVDVTGSGLIVNQEATCSINASGVSYIYLSYS